LSVEAVQLKLIWMELTAVAVRLLGIVGACVSDDAARTVTLVLHSSSFRLSSTLSLVSKVPAVLYFTAGVGLVLLLGVPPPSVHL
jgi:hypothetical protein